MQRRRFDAELSEGVSQRLLRHRELSELTGQRLGQLGHVVVALPVVFEQLQPRLQLQVDGPRPAAELLRQSLPGALRRDGYCQSRRRLLISDYLSLI